ncbi:metallophosphoesterase [Sorangium sp. So ce1000]|uniref:metallophosphoesterase n=1 Tax=Sorangium sp. So ce1000 TaxID=3133325 RepID=UPI003F614A8A
MAAEFKAVLQAFQPAKEITDPNKFAGRREQVERGAELLLSHDHIFIHGIRGIGKSSLANQLALIAEGDTPLLSDIGSSLASNKFDYVTCFLRCDDSVANVNALLYRILIDPEGVPKWSSLLDLKELPAFDLGNDLNPRLVSEFWARIEKLSSLATDGVAVFIDEFERLPSHSGFSSLVKAAPKHCIFVVTGIAKTEKELVEDHESIQRQLSAGKLFVPQMSEEELRVIVSKAEAGVGRDITFEEPATVKLVKISRGHPYMLHLVGGAAMVRAFKEKSSTVTVSIIEQSLKDISTGKINSFLEERYLNAIGNSMNREIVLRVFAELPGDSIPTSTAYPIAEQRGVTNVSYYVGDLQKQQFGAEMEKVGDRFYVIPDSLFKAYAAATPPRLTTDGSAPWSGELFRQRRRAIHLVHLSDLHFGSSHYFSNLALSADNVPSADKPSFEKYFSDAIKSHSREAPLDLLVISGDLTQRAMWDEFDAAGKCVKSILPLIKESASEPGRRLVMVPGNHDVNWGLGGADPGLKSLPFISYIKFRGEFGGKFGAHVERERLYEVHDFIDDLGCIVVALNSAVLEDPKDHRGYIGETQIGNALSEVQELARDRECVKIAVLHHHLTPVSSIEEDLRVPDEPLRDAAYVKKALLEEEFSLVLHGHRHHGHEELVGTDKRQMVIVGCGSSGVVATERGSQPLQFNRITISRDRVSATIEIAVQRMHFDASRRKWLPSAEHLHTFKVADPTFERVPF